MSSRHSDLTLDHLPWLKARWVKPHHNKNANFLGAWHDITSGAAGARHQRAQRLAEIAAERAKEAEQAQPDETEDKQDSPLAGQKQFETKV